MDITFSFKKCHKYFKVTDVNIYIYIYIYIYVRVCVCVCVCACVRAPSPCSIMTTLPTFVNNMANRRKNLKAYEKLNNIYGKSRIKLLYG